MAVDKGMVDMLAEEMRRVLESRRGQRLTLGQLRMIMAESSEQSISLAVVEEAVRELDGEGVVQFNERTSSVVIRGSV